MNIEKEIVEKAGKWHEANIALRVAQNKVDDAESLRDKAQNAEHALRLDLAKTVGANIKHRCISMQNGSVVLVQYNASHENTVIVEELLR